MIPSSPFSRAASSSASPAPGNASEMRIAVARRQYLFQQFAPLCQIHLPQIVSVQVQQVEREVDHRRGSGEVRHRIRIAVGDARLNQVELRYALRIQHRDLAVQHGACSRPT